MCIREWGTQYFCDNMCELRVDYIEHCFDIITWKPNKCLQQNNYEGMYASGTHEICMAKFSFLRCVL